jgi:hypothetical protein
MARREGANKQNMSLGEGEKKERQQEYKLKIGFRKSIKKYSKSDY